jgi:hemerythrin
MLNSFEGRLRNGESPTILVDVVHGLAAYAKEHFAFEEGCMERCACSAASVNKLAHQRFVRMVTGMLEEFKTTPPSRDAFESLHRELVDWLKSHICKIDIRLRERATANGPSRLAR